MPLISFDGKNGRRKLNSKFKKIWGPNMAQIIPGSYSTVEKECLSLILALQHFEVYLASSVAPIVIFTDHNPLTFIHKMKNKNQRLLRWSLMLQEHNLDIRHIKGKDNIIPDALSRA